MPEKAIINIIIVFVIQIRKYLSVKYDVTPEGNDAFYSGLCDIACDEMEKVIPQLEIQLNAQIKVTRYHGEQKHHPRIKSHDWVYQHSWLSLEIDGTKYWVDPTSSQFMNLYEDITPYYVSTVPPKWYYWDGKNPAFNGFTKILEDKITLTIGNCKNGAKHRIRIVSFFQYIIWGSISDTIHRIFYK